MCETTLENTGKCTTVVPSQKCFYRNPHIVKDILTCCLHRVTFVHCYIQSGFYGFQEFPTETVDSVDKDKVCKIKVFTIISNVIAGLDSLGMS